MYVCVCMYGYMYVDISEHLDKGVRVVAPAASAH